MILYESDLVIDIPEDATASDATSADATTETVLVDDDLYLSRVYADKTISDCYSMLVSIRNCVLLLCMIIFLFEAHKVLKTAFRRHYKS